MLLFLGSCQVQQVRRTRYQLKLMALRRNKVKDSCLIVKLTFTAITLKSTQTIQQEKASSSSKAAMGDSSTKTVQSCLQCVYHENIDLICSSLVNKARIWKLEFDYKNADSMWKKTLKFMTRIVFGEIVRNPIHN